MSGAFQAVGDGDVAGGKSDQAARNEEGRYPARSPLLEDDRHFGNAFDAAHTGADQHAGIGLIVRAFWMPARVLDRLARDRPRADDEGINLALIFRLHPFVGIERLARAVTARGLAV